MIGFVEMEAISSGSGGNNGDGSLPGCFWIMLVILIATLILCIVMIVTSKGNKNEKESKLRSTNTGYVRATR